MSAEPDDDSYEYEEPGYDVDEMLNGDPFGPDFPELPDECKRAVERSLVRFDRSDLCGVIVEKRVIWTHLEAIQRQLEANAERNRYYVDFRMLGFTSIRCSVASSCDFCGLVRLGPTQDDDELEVRRFGFAMSSAEPLTVRPFDHTEAFPVFVLDPDWNWIRGWRIGRDCVHELLVESSLKPTDVGCPVVDEEGRIVRVVETTDVLNGNRRS